MSYQRSYLDKLLVQDFGVKWADARRAANRYLIEAGTDPLPWWQMLPGDPYVISEWIAGTDRYWVPQFKRWQVKLEANWDIKWIRLQVDGHTVVEFTNGSRACSCGLERGWTPNLRRWIDDLGTSDAKGHGGNRLS